jgi:diguanylate cyclase (GGDEF)-like protein
MAMTDSLTGLPNRRAFFRKAADIFAAADALELPVAVMMIDLDHFKTINDSYGHDVGDEVIHEVASSIRNAVNDCDGSIEGFAARVGGDEFAVVLASKGHEPVVDLAGCIGSKVRQIGYVHRGGNIATTVSIGVAVREPGEDIDTALAAADEAAYAAKRDGRDRFAVAGGDQPRRATPRRGRHRTRAA